MKLKKRIQKEWQHLIASTRYSLQGLRFAWRDEMAFRQEVIAACILIPLGIYLGHNGIERVLLVGSVVWVLIIELLNSAVEAIINRISHVKHTLSGRAKDLASSAVFLSVLMVPVVWGFVILG